MGNHGADVAADPQLIRGATGQHTAPSVREGHTSLRFCAEFSGYSALVLGDVHPTDRYHGGHTSLIYTFACEHAILMPQRTRECFGRSCASPSDSFACCTNRKRLCIYALQPPCAAFVPRRKQRDDSL